MAGLELVVAVLEHIVIHLPLPHTCQIFNSTCDFFPVALAFCSWSFFRSFCFCLKALYFSPFSLACFLGYLRSFFLPPLMPNMTSSAPSPAPDPKPCFLSCVETSLLCCPGKQPCSRHLSAASLQCWDYRLCLHPCQTRFYA